MRAGSNIKQEEIEAASYAGQDFMILLWCNLQMSGGQFCKTVKERSSILFAPDVSFCASHCVKCLLWIHQASGPGQGQNVAGWKAASWATVVQLCQSCPPTAHLTKSSTTSQPNKEEKIEKTGQELKMRESRVCVCVSACVSLCVSLWCTDAKFAAEKKEKNWEKLE